MNGRATKTPTRVLKEMREMLEMENERLQQHVATLQAELATYKLNHRLAVDETWEQEARMERLLAYWSDTEARSADAHAVYQLEAHRRGDVRHPDAYAELSEATKEWDRVLVRWVRQSCAAILDDVCPSAPENPEGGKP